MRNYTNDEVVKALRKDDRRLFTMAVVTIHLVAAWFLALPFLLHSCSPEFSALFSVIGATFAWYGGRSIQGILPILAICFLSACGVQNQPPVETPTVRYRYVAKEKCELFLNEQGCNWCECGPDRASMTPSYPVVQ